MKKGVILIGDEFTLPALMVDYRIRSVARDSGDPVKTRQQLQKPGAEIARLLENHLHCAGTKFRFNGFCGFVCGILRASWKTANGTLWSDSRSMKIRTPVRSGRWIYWKRSAAV